MRGDHPSAPLLVRRNESYQDMNNLGVLLVKGTQIRAEWIHERGIVRYSLNIHITLPIIKVREHCLRLF